MNIIEKYKNNRLEKKPIKIVINSNFDYKNHDINVLKECLKAWSNDDSKNSPFNFEWMFVDPKQKEKVFFVSTNLRELKQFKLNEIVNNKDLMSEYYMNSYFMTALYSENINNYKVA